MVGDDVSRCGRWIRRTSAWTPSELTSTRPVLETEMPSPCGCDGSVTVPTSCEAGERVDRGGAVGAQQHVTSVGEERAVGDEARHAREGPEPVLPARLEVARRGVHGASEHRLRHDVDPLGVRVHEERLGVVGSVRVGQRVAGGRVVPVRQGVQVVDVDTVAVGTVVAGVAGPQGAVAPGRDRLDVGDLVGVRRPGDRATGARVDAVDHGGVARVVVRVDDVATVDQSARLEDVVALEREEHPAGNRPVDGQRRGRGRAQQHEGRERGQPCASSATGH